MRIAIRVDASGQIGTGHFMRCLTLAEEFKKHDVQILFVSRRLPEHLRRMLTAKGHQFVLLDSIRSDQIFDDLAHSHWLGVSQEQDAMDTIQVLAGGAWDWLIVDHYGLDVRWESVLRNSARQIMVIDDIADRQHDCDILLDQNYYTDMELRYIGKVPEHCQLLLGPRYALLRDEFRQLHKDVKPRNGPVKRILVFFGGVDDQNYTGRAIEALSKIDIPELHVDVVIGELHPYLAQITTESEQNKFVCHVQTERMADLMAAADLGIGAGGSATWERCCLGLPTLAFCTADNQQRQIADAAQEGLLYSPEIVGNLNHTIQRHAIALIENTFFRQFVSRKSMQLVDFRGVFRVISKIVCSTVCGVGAVVDVRLAVADDAELVWPWRNNEETRRYFFDPAPVNLDTHLAWWNQSLSDPQRLLLIGRFGGREVCVIRYDFIESRQAKISIFLDPEMTGRGLGECCLRAGQDWLFRYYPEIETVIAEVIKDNRTSLRVFFAAGFQEQYVVLTYGRRVIHDHIAKSSDCNASRSSRCT